LSFVNRVALLALFLSGLAGCAATPASLGLTGSGLANPPEQPSDADIGTPGLNEGGGPYTPSVVPHTGPGRYFGSD
jgi:hypothetical protein